MSDYIGRQDAIATIWNMCPKGIFVDVAQTLKDLPSADVRENVHGEWIPWKYHNGFRCEHCNEPVDNKHNFCPNCGADMRKSV